MNKKNIKLAMFIFFSFLVACAILNNMIMFAWSDTSDLNPPDVILMNKCYYEGILVSSLPALRLVVTKKCSKEPIKPIGSFFKR